VAVTSEALPWLSSALPNTELDEREPIVSALGGKLLTAASSSHGLELGLAVVERFLGRRSTGALRATLGCPPVSRIELPDPLKITLP
jgi:hypothetical protein